MRASPAHADGRPAIPPGLPVGGRARGLRRPISPAAPGSDRAPRRPRASRVVHLPNSELEACREISDRCAFVIGPARSGTTILAQLINTNDRAFITTEAGFYRASDHRPFRDWYNAQHRSFGNQVCKSTYAPNLGASEEDSWWQWLARAAGHFDLVGDKFALTHLHLDDIDRHRIQEFHEARFFDSRYVFVFRDPVQTLLGSAVLGFTDARCVIRSWGTIVKLWAYMIRIFPHTMTVLLEDLDAIKVAEIGAFLGLDLSESARLLDPREQRRHRTQDVSWGEAVARVSPLLNMIYGEIRDTLRMDCAWLQADQKRDRPDGTTRVPRSSPSEVAVVSTPLGRAWNLADQLVSWLGADVG
jgi:hypothetical protein